MHRGYIKLYRKILDNPLVRKDSDYLSLRIYLLLTATFWWSDVIFLGKRIHLDPGQLVTGRKRISKELKISESKIQRILKHFQEDQQIEQQMSNGGRVITIINWELYQGVYETEDNMNNQWTINEHWTNIIIESKKIKNEKIKLSDLKNLNWEIDLLINAAKTKCKAYDLIYNPAQERRFAHNILKKQFREKISELWFMDTVNFVETIIDMSMQPWNWWMNKIAWLKDIHRNYPRVYAWYKSAKQEEQSISSF